MIFFLLSGFVIASSMYEKKYTFKTYFKHRFFRIYTVILFAWIISLIFYLLLGNSLNDISLTNFILNLFMLQDISALKPGVIVDPIFGNSPLWSLSYEWWFYMFFFFHLYLYKKYFDKKLIFFNFSALLISLMGLILLNFNFNNIFLIFFYYYIWFSGVMIFYFLKENKLDKIHLSSLLISYLVLILVYIILFISDKELGNIGVHPLLELRHYAMAFISLFIIFIVYSYFYIKVKDIKVYKKTIQLLGTIAPISFGIYVFHYPIYMYLKTYTQINSLILLIITLFLTLFLSFLVEVKIYKLIRNKI